MFTASWEGDLKKVQQLIQHKRIGVDDFCEHPTNQEYCSTPLYNTCKCGHFLLVKELLEKHGANVNKHNINL